jgi:hypothetical protein
MATTTTTTAMMTMNVDNKALGASAQHFYMASCNGNNDINYDNDDDKCRQQGLGRERSAFLHRIAQRR